MDILLSLQAEISLVAVLVIVLLADLIGKEPNYKRLQKTVYVLLALHIALNLRPFEAVAFGGMYHTTPMACTVKSLLTLGTLLVFMQASQWLEREDTRHKAGEFYVLTLSTLLGMYFMVSAGSFLLFYVGLELASIPMACLIAFDKYRHHSAEAGAKFILNSMFSSALMLYGLSFIYCTCGTAYFAELTPALTGTPLQVMALVLFFAGLGFKLSLVPFHMWTPDTYQGAPAAVSGYLSVISKGAAAFALISILHHVFAPMLQSWNLLVSIVLVASITVANLFALLQHDLKRFMAYSSISQAGYIMLAVLGETGQGTTSLVYYIAVYLMANLAVFGVIGLLEQQTGGPVERSTCNALYTTNPRLAFVMTIALFSLAGIPPFAGFFSKFFVFAAAFHTGHWAVVFLALVNTIISLYYYLLVVKAMYIMPSDAPVAAFRSPLPARVCLLVCLLSIMLMGVCSSVYQYIAAV